MFSSNFPQRDRDYDDEVNLTPMMNLFVVLIPFLLMSAAFFKLSIINAAVPTIADAPLEKGQSDKVLNVNLRIEKDGFHISGSGDGISNSELASIRKHIRKTGATYNYDGLNAALTQIKWRFPKGKSMMLFPAEQITYDQIVQVMDTARWSHEIKNNQKQLLYPDIVVTSVQGGN